MISQKGSKLIDCKQSAPNTETFTAILKTTAKSNAFSSTKRTLRITWPAEDLFIVIWLPVMFFSVRAELSKLLTLDCYVAHMVKYTK